MANNSNTQPVIAPLTVEEEGMLLLLIELKLFLGEYRQT